MTNLQGSQVFLLADIQSMLQAILLTNEAALRVAGGNEEYRQGFMAAISIVATAVGCRLDTQWMQR
jgi:hypothetical protein